MGVSVYVSVCAEHWVKGVGKRFGDRGGLLLVLLPVYGDSFRLSPVVAIWRVGVVTALGLDTQSYYSMVGLCLTCFWIGGSLLDPRIIEGGCIPGRYY